MGHLARLHQDILDRTEVIGQEMSWRRLLDSNSGALRFEHV